jgi:hypothetical protein
VLWLDSIDGLGPYDTIAGRQPACRARSSAVRGGPVIAIECGADLMCHLTIDRGDGPTRLEGVGAEGLWYWSIQVSPDGAQALLPADTEEGRRYTLLHLDNAETVDLGSLGIEPYFGVAWVDGDPWIVAHQDPGRGRWLALNTDTGEQIDIEAPFSSGEPVESVLLYVPSG